MWNRRKYDEKNRYKRHELSSAGFNDKKSLEENPEGLDIIVDNNTARGNVERFLKNAGYRVAISEQGDTFLIEARK